MPPTEKVKEFPDVSNKLAAPKKLSAFEKERQAAEAKRLRAEEENAAALREFQNSFDHGNDEHDHDEDEDDPLAAAIAGRATRGGGGGMGPRQGRMPPAGPKSGPGSVGPVPGLPPPPSLKRKRALDEMREAQEARRAQGMALGYRDDSEMYDEATYSTSQDNELREVEEAAPRPTVQLSQLPPNITQDEVRALVTPYLSVHAVQLLPPPPPSHPGFANGSGTKRSISAIVLLEETETSTTTQIDTAVSALKDRYLGYGFRLAISRHLSSAALHPSLIASATNVQKSSSDEPFGAQRPRDPAIGGRASMRNAPPPLDHTRGGGFAPPASYDNNNNNNSSGRSRSGFQPTPPALEAHIPIHPSSLALPTLRAIHILAEKLLTCSSPDKTLEIEALLMATPEVQRDERFAFLYDARSEAGIYYRWVLWGPPGQGRGRNGSRNYRTSRGRDGEAERVWADVPLDWVPPGEGEKLVFPNLKSLADVVDDIDYASSEEESDHEDGEGRRQFYSSGRDRGRAGYGSDEIGPSASLSAEKKDSQHLTPLKRARLIHLLARLPTSHARLRRGDVARVTNFAVVNAGRGGGGAAEEVVDLLVGNVERPVALCGAARYEDEDEDDREDDGEKGASDRAGLERGQENSREEEAEEDEYEPDEDLPPMLGGDSSRAENRSGSASPSLPPAAPPPNHKLTATTTLDDPSTPHLVGLYLLSDLLSASSTAVGVRNAWKFRSLIETALIQQRTFEKLAKLEKVLGMGRLKAEQWKRRVNGVLALWEGWSVFGEGVLENLRKGFEVGSGGGVQGVEKIVENGEGKVGKALFRRIGEEGGKVESAGSTPVISATASGLVQNNRALDDVDGAPMEDLDGTAMVDDDEVMPAEAEDLDGAPMEDLDGEPMENMDGVPMQVDDRETAPEKEKNNTVAGISVKASDAGVAVSKLAGPKRRMRAEDMFASDEE